MLIPFKSLFIDFKCLTIDTKCNVRDKIKVLAFLFQQLYSLLCILYKLNIYIDIIFLYFSDFPVVQNETVYFERINRPRTLKCNVLGVPDTYSYSKWLHYTYSNQLVRTLDGQANGKLILPKGDQEDLMYEDSGLYICNVTNHVRDNDGNIWQTGSINLVVKGEIDFFYKSKHKSSKEIYSSIFFECDIAVVVF